jgi:glycine dehydrogenase subunit 1
LSLLGPLGLKQLAELCMSRANLLSDELNAITGIASPYFSGIPFKEFVFQLDTQYSANKYNSFIQSNNIHGGFSLETHFPELKQCYLTAVTEMTSITHIKQYAEITREFISKYGGL